MTNTTNPSRITKKSLTAARGSLRDHGGRLFVSAEDGANLPVVPYFATIYVVGKVADFPVVAELIRQAEEREGLSALGRTIHLDGSLTASSPYVSDSSAPNLDRFIADMSDAARVPADLFATVTIPTGHDKVETTCHEIVSEGGTVAYVDVEMVELLGDGPLTFTLSPLKDAHLKAVVATNAAGASLYVMPVRKH